MSFIAKLILGDNNYNVLRADFGISQPMGAHNLPTRGVEIELINMVIESSSRSELWEWGMLNSMSKNGSIVFYRRDAVSPLKTLEFENAFCVKYKEFFEADGDMPMKIHITLSPYLIRMQNAERLQPWPGFESSGQSGAGETQRSPQHDDSDTPPADEERTAVEDSQDTNDTTADEERIAADDSNEEPTTMADLRGNDYADEERATADESNEEPTTMADLRGNDDADEERATSDDLGDSDDDNDEDKQIPSFIP